MAEDQAPLDGTRWGEWIRSGADLWGVVHRSWSIFARNTDELIRLLNVPATNFHVAFTLMGDDRDQTRPFWDELDQRLHNQVASLVSLVDHSRPLLNFYKDDAPAVLSEYGERNTVIRQMPQTAFLRDLRNYLLHVEVPPIVQTLSLQMAEGSVVGQPGATGHTIKLNAQYLLRWDNWSARSKAYLSSFGDRDGPVIGDDVAAHWAAMTTLFTWFFEQRQVIFNDPKIQNRFRVS